MSRPKKLIRRVPPTDEHEGQKWYVIEGTFEGCPMVTKRRAVNVYALIAGTTTKAAERQKLKDTLNEYYDRWLALQDEPDEDDADAD